ncbi:hypothetical protein Tco_1579938, partial [Tanacetum coccineum]
TTPTATTPPHHHPPPPPLPPVAVVVVGGNDGGGNGGGSGDGGGGGSSGGGGGWTCRLISADDLEPSFKRPTKKPSVSTPSKPNEDVSRKRTDLEDSDVDETPFPS